MLENYRKLHDFVNVIVIMISLIFSTSKSGQIATPWFVIAIGSFTTWYSMGLWFTASEWGCSVLPIFPYIISDA